MALKILKIGEVFSVPRGTLVRGDLTAFDGTIIAAATEYPLGIVMDDKPANDSPAMVDVYGRGTVIDDDSLSLAVTDRVYSDADGTFSKVQPNPGAGNNYYVLGYPLSATSFIIEQTMATDGV